MPTLHITTKDRGVVKVNFGQSERGNAQANAMEAAVEGSKNVVATKITNRHKK